MALKYDLGVMIPLLLAAVLVQDMQPVIPRLGGKINWLAAVVVYYSLARERHLTLLAALAAGILLDSLANLPMGGSAVFFVWLAIVLARFRSSLRSGKIRTLALMGLSSAAVMCLYQYLLLRLIGYPALNSQDVFGRMLAQALTGMVITPIVFLLADRLDRSLANMQRMGNGNG